MQNDTANLSNAVNGHAGPLTQPYNAHNNQVSFNSWPGAASMTTSVGGWTNGMSGTYVPNGGQPSPYQSNYSAGQGSTSYSIGQQFNSNGLQAPPAFAQQPSLVQQHNWQESHLQQQQRLYQQQLHDKYLPQFSTAPSAHPVVYIAVPLPIVDQVKKFVNDFLLHEQQKFSQGQLTQSVSHPGPVFAQQQSPYMQNSGPTPFLEPFVPAAVTSAAATPAAPLMFGTATLDGHHVFGEKTRNVTFAEPAQQNSFGASSAEFSTQSSIFSNQIQNVAANETTLQDDAAQSDSDGSHTGSCDSLDSADPSDDEDLDDLDDQQSLEGNESEEEASLVSESEAEPTGKKKGSKHEQVAKRTRSSRQWSVQDIYSSDQTTVSTGASKLPHTNKDQNQDPDQRMKEKVAADEQARTQAQATSAADPSSGTAAGAAANRSSASSDAPKSAPAPTSKKRAR